MNRIRAIVYLMLWTTQAVPLLRSSRSVLAMLLHNSSHGLPHIPCRTHQHTNRHLSKLASTTKRALNNYKPRWTVKCHPLRTLQRCSSSTGGTSSTSARHRLVFLGTPEVGG